MSKLLVKGGPLGGGTMVLESPDTEDDYTLTLPAKSGTVSVLDAASGSPVMADGTPVVESGSNSDGSWTKFGDGTAKLRRTRSLPTSIMSDGSTGAGTYYSATQTQTLPIPLVGDYTPTGSVRLNRADSPYIGIGAFNSTLFDYYVVTARDTPSGETMEVFLSVDGYWK